MRGAFSTPKPYREDSTYDVRRPSWGFPHRPALTIPAGAEGDSNTIHTTSDI
jgi:hypothetical protein